MVAKSPRLEDLVEPERIFQAMRDCEKGVRWKASVQNFEMESLRWAAEIRRELLDGTYKSKDFRSFEITERGKRRNIQALHIKDRAVQKLLCQHALLPVITPRLIYDNSACQKGKGTDFAIKRLVEHLRWHIARYGKRGYIVIMDYQNFFGSIPHDKVIDALCDGQEDARICKLIADCVHNYEGDKGLGIGSEISQIAAALYPTPVDRYAKETLRLHCYARYNDDCYCIVPDRAAAENAIREITKRSEALGLYIHPDKTKIHHLASDDFTFLKKRVHVTETGGIVMRITRANQRRERKRIRQQHRDYLAGALELGDARQSYQCWRAYALKYGTYSAVGKMDRCFADTFNLTEGKT